MKKTFTLAIGALMALSAYSSVSLAADAGQPGYYGRIDVSNGPRPKLIYAKPVMIQGKKVNQEPVYLHVRPGQARNWKDHCKQYEACGKRVYFVNHKWYETTYVDNHRQRNAKDRNDDHRDHNHADHRDNDGNRGNDNRDGRHDGNHDHRHDAKHDGKHDGKHDHDGRNDHDGKHDRAESYGNNGRGNDNGRGQGNGKFDNN